MDTGVSESMHAGACASDMGIARDTFAYWFAQMADMAFRMVTFTFAAVILGPEMRGELIGALLANAQAFNLTNLGLQAIALYFTGKFPDRRSNIHATLLYIVLVAVALNALLALVAGEWIRVRIFAGIPWRYLGPALALLPVSFYTFALQGMLTGLGRVAQVSRALFYYSAVSCALNTIAAILYWDQPEVFLRAALSIWIVAEMGKCLAFLTLLRRAGVGRPDLSLSALIRESATMLNYGLRAFIGNFAAVMVNRLDHLFILASSGTTVFGAYSIAPRLAEMVFYPSAAFESAGYSRVAGADRANARDLVVRLFRANFLMGLAGSLGLFVVGPVFIHYALGPEYDSAILPLFILLPGMALFSCSRMLSLYFSAHLGRPQVPSMVAWVAAITNVGLLYSLIVHLKMGMIGAAVAASASYALTLIILLSAFAVSTGFRTFPALFFPTRDDLAKVRVLIRGLLK